MVSREILTYWKRQQSTQKKLDVQSWFQVEVPYIADNTFVHVIFRRRIGLKYQIKVYLSRPSISSHFSPIAFKDAETKSLTPRRRGDTKTFWNSRWCNSNAQNFGELFPYKPQSFAWQKSGEVMNSLHFNSGRCCYCFLSFYFIICLVLRNAIKTCSKVTMVQYSEPNQRWIKEKQIPIIDYSFKRKPLWGKS